MGKTTNPQKLVDLGKLWVKNGGVNLGIKGDLDHVEQGVSYHLGKAELKPNAPSATSARDKAGLTNAASAIDLGKLDKKLANMQAFSRWVVARCMDNPACAMTSSRSSTQPMARRCNGTTVPPM